MAGVLNKIKACNFTKNFRGNFLKFSKQLLCRIHKNSCFYILQNVRKPTWHHMTFPLAKEDNFFSRQQFWVFLFIYFCIFNADLVGYFLKKFGYCQGLDVVFTSCYKNLVETDYKFYKMLKSQFMLELWRVKWMETTALKAETVTGIGFNMYIHFYFYYTILVWAKSDDTV